MEARDYLLEIRKSGLTQAQVAARTSIPQPTISKIERFEIKDVRSKNYRALQSLYLELCESGVVTADGIQGVTPIAAGEVGNA